VGGLKQSFFSGGIDCLRRVRLLQNRPHAGFWNAPRAEHTAKSVDRRLPMVLAKAGFSLLFSPGNVGVEFIFSYFRSPVVVLRCLALALPFGAVPHRRC